MKQEPMTPDEFEACQIESEGFTSGAGAYRLLHALYTAQKEALHFMTECGCGCKHCESYQKIAEAQLKEKAK